MKSLKMFALAALVGGMTMACENDTTSPAQPRTVQGAAVSVGDGTVTPWVRLDGNGRPEEWGLRVSEDALEGLPETMPGTSWVLRLPSEASATGINHISFDYNPNGHDPDPIYGHAHFDVHFYYVSEAARDSIGFGPDMTPIETSFIPQDYMTFDHMSIPRMGVHYVDTTSHEFHGHHFDETLMYGFSKGKLTFVEPMITTEYLQKKLNLTKPVKQPQRWQNSSLTYATQQSIRWDNAAKAWDITLKR